MYHKIPQFKEHFKLDQTTYRMERYHPTTVTNRTTYYNVIQNVAFTQILYNVRLSTLIPILCMLGLTWMNR